MANVVNRYIPQLPPSPYLPQQSPYYPKHFAYDPKQPSVYFNEANERLLASPIGLEHEVYQHGSIGEFITSGIEGAKSGFIRCIYREKWDPEHTVTLLCDKIGGCCVTGCCPKDQFWMSGLILLLIFVLLVFCGGAIIIIFCYQRSKNRERREEKSAEVFGRPESGGNSEIPFHSPEHGKATPSPFLDDEFTR